MRAISLLLFLSFTIILILSTSLIAGYKVDKSYHGFKLTEKRFVKEVNAECFYFIHEKSGARLLKIAADDPNKTFSIAFKTVPESDAGTPHIMEHSVLNGSKNFPVKSPFDVLSKGSLNTFLNAMTGGDITIYPVASMNDKDYFNLMHVYLDAVFNPLIYDDPRILKQEGWHHELLHKDSAVVYKGVVYNEMKGAFSNPTREKFGAGPQWRRRPRVALARAKKLSRGLAAHGGGSVGGQVRGTDRFACGDAHLHHDGVGSRGDSLI